jgi:cellulose synthase (UDP-forming)
MGISASLKVINCFKNDIHLYYVSCIYLFLYFFKSGHNNINEGLKYMDAWTLGLLIAFCSVSFILILFFCFSYKKKIFVRLIGFLGIILGLAYITWRIAFSIPSVQQPVDFVFGLILLITEIIGLLQSIVFKTVYNTDRKYEPNKDLTFKRLPSLDVFISTYNEPVEILSRTILAAKRIDYPSDRLTIYVGDDGHRQAVKDFCLQCGVHYVTRDNNAHAKAGNINNVLSQSHGELILLLDADMIPKKSIARYMVDYFQDSKTGFVQSPQVFYNHDVYQHNLGVKDYVPNEQDFFMRTLMEKRAAYNAVLHIGSNAIFRRKAIEDIGGIPTKSITEDMATGMLIQAKGYKSFYVNKPLAIGRSVETIGDLVKQRDRWLRGSIQVAKKYNPLTVKGLNFMQRLVYFDGVMYWTFGLQKMIYIIAPFLYLLAGLMLFKANGTNVAMVFLPYFISNTIYFRRVSDDKRSITWSHIYDMALAPQMAWSLLVALFTKKAIKFNVTPKDVLTQKDKFNWKLALPHIILLALTLASLGMGIAKLYWYWNTDAVYAVIMNMFWCLYNGLGIIISIFVFTDRRNARNSVRIPAHLKTTGLITSCAYYTETQKSKVNSCSSCGIVRDISDDGVDITCKKNCSHLNYQVGDYVSFSIQRIGDVKAKVVRRGKKTVR